MTSPSEKLLPPSEASLRAAQRVVDVYSLVGQPRSETLVQKVAIVIDSEFRRAPEFDAAEICAEMAREAATRAAKYDSPYAELGESALLTAERHHGMADALREAERRIRSRIAAPV